MKRRITRKKAEPSKGKVRNATVVECDGITFKSKLEAYCYEELKKHNLEATYEGKTFILIDAFRYEGFALEKGKKAMKGIRKTTYTPDFIGKGFIIECKGHANETFPIKWKLLKSQLYKAGNPPDLYMPQNKKQIDEVIRTIRERSENKKISYE